MERAAVTGVLAAGDVLAAAGVRAEPVEVIRPQGLLRRTSGNVAGARIAGASWQRTTPESRRWRPCPR
jgi:hypothetical protein